MDNSEIKVKVWDTLDGCPLREELEKVKRAVEGSGLLREVIARSNRGPKTFGILSVQFGDGATRTIASMSGIGVQSFWTGKEAKMSNRRLRGVEEKLRDHGIVWAELSCEHVEYQQLLEKEEIQEKDRQEFAKEYRSRLSRKVKQLKMAKLSREELHERLRRSAEFRPNLEEDFEQVVDFYDISTNDVVFEIAPAFLEIYLSSPNPREYLIEKLCKYPMYRFLFVYISVGIAEQRHETFSLQEVIDSYIRPFRSVITELFLDLYAIALGLIPPTMCQRLADMTVQCAEDNALKCLAGMDTCATVKQLEWVAATFTNSSISHKKLCAFCTVAFEPRAKQIADEKNTILCF